MGNKLSKSRQAEINNRNAIVKADKEMLESTKYPKALVPDWFGDVLRQAMIHKSMRSLDCDWQAFDALLHKCPESHNLLLMGKALNAIEDSSMFQLGVTCVHEYSKIQSAVIEMAVKWNAIVAPLREQIAAKYSGNGK